MDSKYVAGGNQFNPALVAQQAQDPNNPANPNHPKVSQTSDGVPHRLPKGIEERVALTMSYSITNGPASWLTNLATRQLWELVRRLEQTL